MVGMVDMVEALGHRALQASSGAEALVALDGMDSVDILITDLSMPGMSGVELARLATPKCPGLAVIIATGYAELPQDAPSGLRRIGKPFDVDDLERSILACRA